MYVGTWSGGIDIHSYSGKCNISLNSKTTKKFALVDHQGVCQILVDVPAIFHKANKTKAGGIPKQVGAKIDPLLGNAQINPQFSSFTVGQGGIALTQGKTGTISSANPVIFTHNNGIVRSTGTTTDFSQNIGGYPVGWGRWSHYNMSAELGGIEQPQDDENGLLWSSYKPSSSNAVSSRIGAARYTNTIDSLAQSSMGKVSNVSVQMDVDFSNGQVSNGAISAHVPKHTWVGVFDGKVSAGKLSLDFSGGALVNAKTGESSHATGSIAGDFVGDNAQAITGAFNMSESANSDNQIEGLFLVGEK